MFAVDDVQHADSLGGHAQRHSCFRRRGRQRNHRHEAGLHQVVGGEWIHGNVFLTLRVRLWRRLDLALTSRGA